MKLAGRVSYVWSGNHGAWKMTYRTRRQLLPCSSPFVDFLEPKEDKIRASEKLQKENRTMPNRLSCKTELRDDPLRWSPRLFHFLVFFFSRCNWCWKPSWTLHFFCERTIDVVTAWRVRATCNGTIGFVSWGTSGLLSSRTCPDWHGLFVFYGD